MKHISFLFILLIGYTFHCFSNIYNKRKETIEDSFNSNHNNLISLNKKKRNEKNN